MFKEKQIAKWIGATQFMKPLSTFMDFFVANDLLHINIEV